MAWCVAAQLARKGLSEASSAFPPQAEEDQKKPEPVIDEDGFQTVTNTRRRR